MVDEVEWLNSAVLGDSVFESIDVHVIDGVDDHVT